MKEFIPGKNILMLDAHGGGGGGYTQRQLDMLNLKVEPATNDEWVWLQDHCNDMVAPDEVAVDAATEKSKPEEFTGAGHYQRWMDDNDK